jgi:hypothetical protein
MRLFVDSYACRSRAHCRTCRDLRGGRSWREGLAATYRLPGGAPDWTCPHGVNWGIARPPEPIPADHDPEQEQRRLQSGGCCGAPSRANV